MDLAVMPARWQVVAKLQNHRHNVAPGSQEEQIIERALDLALSQARSQEDPGYLYRDVYRNASYNYHRSVRRAGSAIARYSAGADLCSADGALDGFAAVDLEETVSANELLSCLKEAAAAGGKKGLLFLERILAGHTPAEAGKSIGVSRATAYRMRRSLCEVAVTWRSRTSG